jgi:hypothetical protein
VGHHLPQQALLFLADHFQPIPAKRNGGGSSVISRVDDYAITISAGIAKRALAAT